MKAKEVEPTRKDEKKPEVQYRMIRQPYRVTMARWDFTPIQKRILTLIISSIQKEIDLVQNGLPIGQLDMFSANADTVTITFPINDLVLNGNNHAYVKKALNSLRKVDVELTKLPESRVQEVIDIPHEEVELGALEEEILPDGTEPQKPIIITLPAVKSKKSKTPEDEVVITGLIERAVIKRYARTVTVYIHRATAIHLVNTKNGLTSYVPEAMFLTDNRHLQKLYEILSHWSDLEVYSATPEKFRHDMMLGDKYQSMKELNRKVIKPCLEEMKKNEAFHIYAEFSVTKQGTRVVQLNFPIKHRKQVKEEDRLTQVRIDYNISLLRDRLKLSHEQLKELHPITSNPRLVKKVLEKIAFLDEYLKNNKKNNPPAFVVQSLKNEFPEIR